LRQPSEYNTQLREKQKARRIYGVLERQFRNMYEEANRQAGITGENLLRMLESRLDNVVFRAGWGASRNQARQLVRHGHVSVDGQNSRIELSAKAREFIVIRHNLDTIDRRPPAWLEVEDSGNAVRVLSLPLREQIDTQVREQLIVELYSK
jgi:small subunit ribosomal protein S4